MLVELSGVDFYLKFERLIVAVERIASKLEVSAPSASTNSAMVPCLKYHNDGGKCVVLFAGKKCGDSPCLLSAQHQ